MNDQESTTSSTTGGGDLPAFEYDGQRIPYREGMTIGAALTDAGVRSWRTTRFGGKPRGIFCGIGVCFDCLITVDGKPNQRACLTPASDAAAGRLHVTGPAPRSRVVEHFEVVVIGAGPAGLAAASTIARSGTSVALLDAGARPGGQYWRHPGSSRPWPARFSLDGVRQFMRTPVWALTKGITNYPRDDRADGSDQLQNVAKGFTVHVESGRITADRLVLAPGAYDRQIPFPGWDLPGVYTAGGAQALLKEHDVLVGKRVAVAGTGPFLLPVAVALAKHGAKVVGIFEANSGAGWLRPGAMRAPSKAWEGIGYAKDLARFGIPIHLRSAVIAAHGTDHVEAITYARLPAGGSAPHVPADKHRPVRKKQTEVDALAVGWGFTPQLELPLALGCQTRVDVDGSLVVDVNVCQESSVQGVFVAGEATGVGGAQLAVVEGELAGLASVDAPAPARLLRKRHALRAFARTMHEAHPVPPGWSERLADETLICRCEEVSSATLREAVELGADNPRTAKQLTRTGMGWCQGRVCGYATACLTAEWTGAPYDPRGMAERPIADPISLGALARSDD